MTIGKHVLSFIIFLCGMLNVWASTVDYTITAAGNEGTRCKFEDTRVNCLYKDADGFVWIGTGATVERINGKTTLVYHFAEKQKGTAPSPFLVNALIENGRHDFWVGTIQGLWRMNHSTRLLERMFADEINISVQSLEIDSEHRLYIGTANGLYIYDGQQLRHIIIDEKNVLSNGNQVLDIAVHGSNSIWLLTPGGVVLCDAKSGALKQYSCNLSSCGSLRCLDKVENMLYIGTEKGGIITFDLNSLDFASSWNEIKVPVSSLVSAKNMLAVATQGRGVFLLSLPEMKTLYSVVCSTEAGQDLLSNMVSSIIFVDDDIWCGTNYYQGLNILRQKNQLFRRYDKGVFASKDIAVRSFWENKEYTFIGTIEGFYYIHKPTGKLRFIRVRDDVTRKLRSNLIFSFYEHGGNILIGTCGGGLAAFNPRSATFSETPLTRTCVSNDIFMFLEDEEGTLWVATSEGLYSYDKETGTVRNYNASNSDMPGNIVYGIYIDSSRRFWLGTDKGLALFDSKTGKCSQFMLPEEYCKEAIRYINEGRDGTLLFTLLNYSLLVADKSLKHFRYPLPTHCQNVMQDNQGYYWLGKWDGLLRVDEKMEHYKFVPALNELSATAGPPITKDEEGKLWICGTKGLFIVNPQVELASSIVRITEMQVNGSPYINNYILPSDSVLELKSSENNITFRFASLGYEDPEQIKYEYMLEGRDSVWVELVNEDKVSYYGLPAGDYVFKVRKLLDLDSVGQVSFRIAGSRVWLVYLGMLGLLMAVVAWGLFRRKAKQPAMSKQEDALLLTSEPDVPTVVQPEMYTTTQSENYAKMSDEEAYKVIGALKMYMQEHEPYLNVDLKQSEVAVAIGCPTYILSAVFTHYLKTNYYDFINGYRVERFKQSVGEGQHKKYTLVTLAEKCGFKSKASFFRAFKKFTGTTPNEYIQQYGD